MHASCDAMHNFKQPVTLFYTVVYHLGHIELHHDHLLTLDLSNSGYYVDFHPTFAELTLIQGENRSSFEVYLHEYVLKNATLVQDVLNQLTCMHMHASLAYTAIAIMELKLYSHAHI